jgi:hypothetical protein
MNFATEASLRGSGKCQGIVKSRLYFLGDRSRILASRAFSADQLVTFCPRRWSVVRVSHLEPAPKAKLRALLPPGAGRSGARSLGGSFCLALRKAQGQRRRI